MKTQQLILNVLLFPCIFGQNSISTETTSSTAAPSTRAILPWEVDVNDKASVLAAGKLIAAKLLSYTRDTGFLTPNTAPTAQGSQWYEAGMLLGSVYEYAKASGDYSFHNKLDQVLAKESHGSRGQFYTGDPEGPNIWNDDAGWWALASVAASQSGAGNRSLAQGASSPFLVSLNTHNLIFSDWENQCNGGIWWYRDQVGGGKKAGYKASITNIQAIFIASHLSIQTGQYSYAQQAGTTYNWLKTSNIIDDQWNVWDGVRVGGCRVTKMQFSYQTGLLVGALATLTEASGNMEFLQDAHRIFTASVPRYTVSGVLTDPCEVKGDCAQDSVTPKGALLRGWSYLHRYTNSYEIQSQITGILKASTSSMLATCNDNFDCGNNWVTKKITSSNVHFMMNTLELITAYIKSFDHILPASAPSAPSAPAAPAAAVQSTSTITTANSTESVKTKTKTELPNQTDSALSVPANEFRPYGAVSYGAIYESSALCRSLSWAYSMALILTTAI
jgi:mannan endo-1,6-alpha-mannosidase